uniref:Putative mavicyanin-like n=1 Tax=Davidia involucrata TaxID=16924 RepID=A0A5B7BEY8_DAVIN
MAMAAALLILLVAAPAAYAAEHVVGGSTGWSTSGNYATWAAGQTFTVGDTLLFNYDSGTHSVDQVSQADYTNCNAGNALQTYTGGKTTVSLTTAGPLYFMCPTSGHCQQGMKLAVTVVAASTTPGGSSPSGSPPSTPTTPPPPPPPPRSGAAGSTFGSMNCFMLGLSIVVGTMLAFMG